jgi:site-specific DNA-methyltransferase (adenine-specific)
LIQVRKNKPLNGSRDSAVLKFWTGPINNGHPAEKPLPLIAYLIGKATDPDDVVFDPFMGSGTTLRAAKDLGRKAIGIEIEERYCEIAAKRLSQMVLPLQVA